MDLQGISHRSLVSTHLQVEHVLLQLRFVLTLHLYILVPSLEDLVSLRIVSRPGTARHPSERMPAAKLGPTQPN